MRAGPFRSGSLSLGALHVQMNSLLQIEVTGHEVSGAGLTAEAHRRFFWSFSRPALARPDALIHGSSRRFGNPPQVSDTPPGFRRARPGPY